MEKKHVPRATLKGATHGAPALLVADAEPRQEGAGALQVYPGDVGEPLHGRNPAEHGVLVRREVPPVLPPVVPVD